MEKEIKGISCEVKNCVHHDVSNTCTAGHINVGTQSAKTTSETTCQTFECCDGCDCKQLKNGDKSHRFIFINQEA